LDNVIFKDVVSKKEMPFIVKAADVALIPLRKLDLFKGAIPSKVFENLAMRTPIVLGVEGEAKDLFIKEGNAGVFYEPENATEMAEAIEKLLNTDGLIEELGENGRRYVHDNFNRDALTMAFYQKLKSIA